MMTTVRNRLLTIGVLWGVLLAAVPTLVMARPYSLSRFLGAALVYVVAGGLLLGPAFGTLVNRAVVPERGRP